MWQSSNPALNNDQALTQLQATFGGQASTTTSLQGVVNKTGILVAIAVTAGAAAYALLPPMQNILLISCVVAMVVSFGVYFMICGNPARAKTLAPIYAIVEGAFLGVLTRTLDGFLVQMNAQVPGGVALQAFIITISIMVAMLVLYKAKILKPTQTFVSVVKVATVGIMLTYLVSFVLSLFGTALPFVSLASAFQGGTAGWIGVGINVLILGVASMWLIIDFKLVEDLVAEGAPKEMEWYAGFGLLVTLAWIYFEAVKLVFRLAILLNSRD